jgi:NAD(P)-dependent dehydrogenase (short-subunit alcohol dehydrogenase family)
MSDGAWVVTGAASGIGAACARRFRGFAGRAVLVDLDASALEAAAESLGEAGGSAVQIAGDLRVAATLDRITEFVASEGGLVALAHAAGLSGAASDAESIVSVNLTASARLLDALEPHIREGAAGALLASQAGILAGRAATAEIDAVLDDPLGDDLFGRLVSVAGAQAEHPQGAYGLSKRGVQRLVVNRAPAWGARGGRLVSVSPGPIDTPMGRREVAANGDPIAMIKGKTPVGSRMGRPEEVAEVIAFLCSPAASFVSGIDLLVDGGSTHQLLRASG